jgi:hypothetical protein
MDTTEAATLAQLWIEQWTELQKSLSLARQTAARDERSIEDELENDDPNDDVADGALEILDDLVENDPEAAWTIITAIVHHPESARVIGAVGAGPLERLMVGYARLFIDRVEQAAAHDEQFRKALSSVWGWSAIPTEILDRIARAVGRPDAR